MSGEGNKETRKEGLGLDDERLSKQNADDGASFVYKSSSVSDNVISIKFSIIDTK